MRLTFILSEAIDSLAANTRRASLAALGLLVGVAAVVSVIATGEGLRTLIERELGIFGRPTALIVRPNWEYLASTGWKTRPESFSTEDIQAMGQLGSMVTGVTPIAHFQFTVKRGDRSRVSRMLAVSSDYFGMEHLRLDRGRFFNSSDDDQMRRVAVLGAALAEKLSTRTARRDGNTDILGDRVSIGTFGEVEVIGILERESASVLQSISDYDSTNNGSIFVPYSAATRFGADRRGYELHIEASSVGLVEKCRSDILTILSELHGTWSGAPKFAIRMGKNAADTVGNMTGLVTSFIAAVAGISLVVAGIGVMNVMLIAVKERTREIGTRKALGAKEAWIRRQFLIESLAVCLAGGAAGVLLAYGIAHGIAFFAHWPALVPRRAVPLALCLSTVTALASGWLPAVRAAKLEAAEALRYE